MRDHLRAIFVLFHLAAIGSLCIPAPVGGLTKTSYDNRSVQKTFAEYAAMLRGLGVDIDREGLQDRAWAGGRWLLDVRAAAVEPFRPYHRVTGTQQGWRMFGYVNRIPARIEVHLQVEPGGAWRPLYVARSNEHVWRRRQLDQERFRALLNAASHHRSKKRYLRAVSWFAARAAEDFPSAHAIRVQMVELPVPPAAELRSLDARPIGATFWRAERGLAERR